VENAFLIVGLGNPGAEYARTRHNAGFMLVDLLAARWRAGWQLEKKFQARVARGEFAGCRGWLAQPQTFMNASGEAVAALLGFHRLPRERLLVTVDDADLPLGEIRLRPGGGSGGHHGLESIAAHLGTKAFARQRLGIGRQNGRREITGHVLGRLSAREQATMDRVLARAAEQVECWLTHGLQKAMSQFNGVVEDSTNEGKAK
jgi:PTH1 family peptidyl-tRNA hydrolase